MESLVEFELFVLFSQDCSHRRLQCKCRYVQDQELIAGADIA